MEGVAYALAFTVWWLLTSSGLFLVVLTWPWTRYMFAIFAVAGILAGEPLAGAGFGTVAVLGWMTLYYAGDLK